MTPLRIIADTFTLALVVWREARGEAPDGRAAVAHSIVTRVAHPGWWGSDVMSVVYKKWQYSSMTDPHDAQLTVWPQPGDPRWWECLQLACDVLEGKVPNPAPGADSYYDESLAEFPPKWATAGNFVKKVGRLFFHAVQPRRP
jgi:N-acetylmuramoyl-L-alanine amidase